MFYYNDFIEWCILTNNDSIQFIKTQENINSLFEFIKERYTSEHYLRTINVFETWFYKKGNQYDGEKMEGETMRMTISL